MGAVGPAVLSQAVAVLSAVRTDDTPPGCEQAVPGFLREPASAWSSLAFVIAGVVIVVLGRRRRRALEAAPAADVVEPSSTTFAVLVAGIGLGSVVAHGPNPFWADLAHDVPLLGTLAFIVADGVADLAGRRRVWWWWALPTAALTPVIHLWPDQGDMSQGLVAVATVLTGTLRGWRRPAVRRPVVVCLVLLATGGLLEILSRDGPLCLPQSLWRGHAAWHIFVAAGLAALAEALGWRRAPTGRAEPALPG